MLNVQIRTSSVVPLSSGAWAPSFSFLCLLLWKYASAYAMGMQKLMPINMMVVIIQGFLKSLLTPERSGPSSSYTARHKTCLSCRPSEQGTPEQWHGCSHG